MRVSKSKNTSARWASTLGKAMAVGGIVISLAGCVVEPLPPPPVAEEAPPPAYYGAPAYAYPAYSYYSYPPYYGPPPVAVSVGFGEFHGHWR